jgi:hypothetical protein
VEVFPPGRLVGQPRNRDAAHHRLELPLTPPRRRAIRTVAEPRDGVRAGRVGGTLRALYASPELEAAWQKAAVCSSPEIHFLEDTGIAVLYRRHRAGAPTSK